LEDALLPQAVQFAEPAVLMALVSQLLQGALPPGLY
jgi:hypothetical protein